MDENSKNLRVPPASARGNVCVGYAIPVPLAPLDSCLNWSTTDGAGPATANCIRYLENHPNTRALYLVPDPDSDWRL
jgi:hypothetical protein